MSSRAVACTTLRHQGWSHLGSPFLWRKYECQGGVSPWDCIQQRSSITCLYSCPPSHNKMHYFPHPLILICGLSGLRVHSVGARLPYRPGVPSQHSIQKNPIFREVPQQTPGLRQAGRTWFWGAGGLTGRLSLPTLTPQMLPSLHNKNAAGLASPVWGNPLPLAQHTAVEENLSH